MENNSDEKKSFGFDLEYETIHCKIQEFGIIPLAEHLENGGRIGWRLRNYLGKILRGEIKTKRGYKRTRAQIEREKNIISEISMLKYFGNRTDHGAMMEWLRRNPKESKDAIIQYMKAAKKDGRWGSAMMHTEANCRCFADVALDMCEENQFREIAKATLDSWRAKYG